MNKYAICSLVCNPGLSNPLILQAGSNEDEIGGNERTSYALNCIGGGLSTANQDHMTANSHQLSSLFEQAVSIAILPINNTSSVPFSQCCHKSAPARPEYAIVALGLTNAGKSTMLAILANEETSGIEPTQGLYTSVQSIKK